jgi:hypothetical protein
MEKILERLAALETQATQSRELSKKQEEIIASLRKKTTSLFVRKTSLFLKM